MERFILTDAQWAKMEPHCLGKPTDPGRSGRNIEICNQPDARLREHVDQFLDRMRVVFRAVNEAVRRASDDAANKKLETLVAERVALFKVDHPNHATREQAMIALRQIEAQLDDSPEAEAIRNAMVPIRRDHHLHEDPAARVDDYVSLLEQLAGLKHAWRAQLSADKQAVTLSAQQRPEERANGKARPSAKARGNARSIKLPAAEPVSASPTGA